MPTYRGSGGVGTGGLAGTTNTLPKFTGANSIGDSQITDTGSLITLPGNAAVGNNLNVGNVLAAAGGLYFGTTAAPTAQLGTSGTSAMTIYGANLGNAQRLVYDSLTELTTIAAAATTTTTIQIPANSIVWGVSTRVTVVIPTAATYSVGVTGTATRYGSGISTAADTTSTGIIASSLVTYSTAVGVLITPDATPADNSGRMRVTIHFTTITPPSS